MSVHESAEKALPTKEIQIALFKIEETDNIGVINKEINNHENKCYISTDKMNKDFIFCKCSLLLKLTL